MKGKKVRMKRLNVPTVMVFAHGLFDGRFKSAGIDPESGTLNSAYVHGSLNLYNKYCNERVDRLETDTAGICTEADALLMELVSLSGAIRESDAAEAEKIEFPEIFPTSIKDSRAAREKARKAAGAMMEKEKLKEQENQMQKRKAEILQRLAQIRDGIVDKETNCRNELSATAFSLKERLCVYGHGVLLRPVFSRHIPQIEYDWAFEFYHANHDGLKQRISKAMKKEEDNYVW